jgi:enamine deaminase RidA (YjgF/YER057c/UK114 family)
MAIRHVNPDGLFRMPDAFSQVVTAPAGRLVFVAGQGAFDADRKIVGSGDYRAQAAQAFRNLRTALAAVGAEPRHVVASTMYVKDLHAEALTAFARGMNEALDGEPFPPNASTLVGVQSLAYPEMLVEVSAIAVVPGAA